MLKEVHDIPSAVRRLDEECRQQIEAIAAEINAMSPGYYGSIARGTSDHAATFLAYAFPMIVAKPFGSIPPSLFSIWGCAMNLEGSVALAISQSGGSEDLSVTAQGCRDSGAYVCALTNVDDSRLEASSDSRIPLLAGEEKSVAATKSFFNSVVAGLRLACSISAGNKSLEQSLDNLSMAAEASLQLEWEGFVASVIRTKKVAILARGPGLGVAAEMALKLQETCQISAIAYSSAEVLHGPVASFVDKQTTLILDVDDFGSQRNRLLLEHENIAGSEVFFTGCFQSKNRFLPIASTGHHLTDYLCSIIPFYLSAERISRRLGLNPDKPVGLRKVTETT